jgi:hypothetical protein
MLHTLSRLSSLKLMAMFTTSYGSSPSNLRSLLTLMFCCPSGPCTPRGTLLPMKSRSTKLASIYMAAKLEYGMNYYETYAPVVTRFSIRLLIVIGILSGWSLRQCNFIMAYPQAPIECNMYIELPQGIQVADRDSMDYVLKELL